MSTESSGRWGDLILLWLWGQKGDGPRAALVKALAKAARAVPGEEVAARVDAVNLDPLQALLQVVQAICAVEPLSELSIA